jgi:MFS transporter, PAT family, beta-lactamase induction signal transducer AmpG
MICQINKKLVTMFVYFQRKILIILLLGFTSGLPLALSASTLLTMLKDYDLDISLIGLFAAVSIPYSLKFLWSPFIDNLNVPVLSAALGRRRSWLFLTQALLLLTIVTLGTIDPIANLYLVAIVALTIAFLSATQDIVIDALRIEMLSESEQGAGAAAIVFGYRVAMLVSSAGALTLAHFYDWTFSYFVMGFLMLPGIVTNLCLVAEPIAKIDKPKTKFLAWFKKAFLEPFTEFLSRDNSIIILIFIILYKLGDAYLGTMTNPFLMELGFDKLEIAKIVKFYGFWATIAGVFVGGWLVAKIGIKNSLFVGCVLQTLSNLVFIVQAEAGHDPAVLTAVIIIENFTGGLGNPVIVAYLSRLCNLNFTATQYALLSSVAVTARSTLSTPSGYLAKYLGWTDFFILTAIISIPALLLVNFCFRENKSVQKPKQKIKVINK